MPVRPSGPRIGVTNARSSSHFAGGGIDHLNGNGSLRGAGGAFRCFGPAGPAGDSTPGLVSTRAISCTLSAALPTFSCDRAVQGGNFGLNVFSVKRELVGDVNELVGDNPADAAGDAQRHHYRNDHG